MSATPRNTPRARGETDPSLRLYEKAETTYLSALNKARSDESIYRALCSLHWDKMNLLIYQSGHLLFVPESEFNR